jgi:hypothetical protein
MAVDIAPRTLEAFLAEERQRIEAFAAYWRASQATDPGMFPAEMAPGDWDEALATYTGEEAGGDGG